MNVFENLDRNAGELFPSQPAVGYEFVASPEETEVLIEGTYAALLGGLDTGIVSEDSCLRIMTALAKVEQGHFSKFEENDVLQRIFAQPEIFAAVRLKSVVSQAAKGGIMAGLLRREFATLGRYEANYLKC